MMKSREEDEDELRGDQIKTYFSFNVSGVRLNVMLCCEHFKIGLMFLVLSTNQTQF